MSVLVSIASILLTVWLFIFGATVTVLTNAGVAIKTNLLSGIGGTVGKYNGWGTGAGTAAVGDTTLSTEAAEARTSGTVTRTTTTVTNDTMHVVALMTSASGQTITNAGLFDASTSGNLYVHSSFSGIPLSTSDSITFTWDIKEVAG